MRVPLSWLREFVPVSLSAADLAEKLTMSGMEVDAIHAIGVFDPLVVVGSLIAREAITPELARLSVTVGGARVLTLVSGAPNAATLAMDTRLAVALPGATILDSDEQVFALRRVEAVIIRKVASEGVACSAREIGVGDDHSGLMVLPSDAPAGSPVREHLTMRPDWEADEVLEVAILPNFARCLAMVGVAREVAALTRSAANLDVPLAAVTITPGAVDARVDAVDDCRRFTTARVTGVEVRPSPRWLQRRLVLSDVTPINNLVDVTNYCMLELGQPMHAYDFARLGDARLGVRGAREGESLRLLTQPEDAPPAELPIGALVVTSADVPVAVAGVVGGRPTSIHGATREVLLESASFEWAAVRRSQSALKVHTGSSARFSRGVDPSLTPRAIARAVKLLAETCPEVAVTATGDVGLREPPSLTLTLRLDELEATLGAAYTLPEVLEALGAVGIGARAMDDGRGVRAVVPPGRADVTQTCDLIEEVARLVGYERLPETLPMEAIPYQAPDRTIEVRERVRDLLVRAGLQEVITYTLTDPDIESKLFAAANDATQPKRVMVRNPVSAHRTAIRTTLVAGLLETLQANVRHTPGAQVFEIGVVVPSAEGAGVPEERQRIAFALSGDIAARSMHGGELRRADFFDGSGVLHALLRSLHVVGVELAPTKAGVFYQPGLAAAVRVGELELGTLGVVHPRVLDAFDLGGAYVVFGELDLAALVVLARDSFAAVAPPRHPSIEIDISMFVEKAWLAAEVVSVVRDAAGPLQREVSVLDRFEGEQVPAGSYSLTTRMELNAVERSLTMKEAQDVRAAVVQALRERVKAEVRE